MGNAWYIRFRWFFLSLSVALLITVIPMEPAIAETLSGKQVSARLDALSQTDQTRLEQDTATALMYYYAEDYAKALPIFKRISDLIKTVDLMYWIGTSATKTGDCDLAIHTLEEALASHPELDRTRLALGVAYQKCGRLQDAEKEFDRVKRSTNSPGIRKQAEKYLAAPDYAAEKWKSSLRLNDMGISRFPTPFMWIRA